MGINSSLSGKNMGVINTVMANSYSRNAGLALDSDLALMLRRGAHRLASVLEHGLLNFAFELKHEVHVGRLLRLTKEARSASGDLRV